MALNNCSITSQAFTKTGGQAIGSDNAQLVITPNPGYVVSASSFTNNTGALDGISAISFSDSDIAESIQNTVLVSVDLDDSYVMPSADTTLVIDIDGDAQLISYSLLGQYSWVVSNATPASQSNITYSSGGNYNQKVTVLTKTFTANTGYYFNTAPSYKLTSANSNRYEITYADTFDGENRLVTRAFTIKYIFSNENESGDFINFIAQAEEFFVPIVEITSYKITKSNISPIGVVREMFVYGEEGAEFSLSIVNEDTTSILSLSNQAIPAEGYYNFYVTFPAVTDNDQYDFVLTGDLSSDFDTVNGQDSTFSIKQLLDISVAIGLTNSNSNILISSNFSKTINPNTLITDDFVGNFGNTFTINTTTINRLNIIDNTVTLTEFTNTSGTLNGGTYLNINSLTFNRISNTEIQAILGADVEITGETDVTSILNLDSYIAENLAPVAQNVSSILSKGDSTPIVLVATDSDNDAIDGTDIITYTVVTLPSNGTLYSDFNLSIAISAGSTITGTTVYYEHDDSNNLTDSFTFKANDGYSDSNIATTNIEAINVGLYGNTSLVEAEWRNAGSYNWDGFSGTSCSDAIGLSGSFSSETDYSKKVLFGMVTDVNPPSNKYTNAFTIYYAWACTSNTNLLVEVYIVDNNGGTNGTITLVNNSTGGDTNASFNVLTDSSYDGGRVYFSFRARSANGSDPYSGTFIISDINVIKNCPQ